MPGDCVWSSPHGGVSCVKTDKDSAGQYWLSPTASQIDCEKEIVVFEERLRAKHRIWRGTRDTGKDEDVVIIYVELCLPGYCSAVFTRLDGTMGCDDFRHFRLPAEQVESLFR